MVSSLPVPGTDSITFHPLSMLANYMSKEQLSKEAEYQTLPVDKIPFLFQLNHIHSGFVQVTMCAGCLVDWRARVLVPSSLIERACGLVIATV